MGVWVCLAFAKKQTPVGNRVDLSSDVDFAIDTFATKQTPVGYRVRFSFDVDFAIDPFATKQTPVGYGVRFSLDVDFAIDTLFRIPPGPPCQLAARMLPFSAYYSNYVQAGFTFMAPKPLPRLHRDTHT